LQKELIGIAMKLKGENEVDIYTDGSMSIEIEGDSSKKRIGIGWIVVNNSSRNSNISFKSRIVNWPSSTRAELGAIWIALLVAPYKANMRIYSDSKAAIDRIWSLKESTSIRDYFKTKNCSLISQIIDCCKTKEINLELIKVKGHSMNKWNDRADKLAKEDLLSNLILEVYEVTTSRISTALLWKNKSIENRLRIFVNLNMTTIYKNK